MRRYAIYFGQIIGFFHVSKAIPVNHSFLALVKPREDVKIRLLQQQSMVPKTMITKADCKFLACF